MPDPEKTVIPAPPKTVIPANAGIQVIPVMGFQGSQPYKLDSGVRRNDGLVDSGLHQYGGLMDSALRRSDAHIVQRYKTLISHELPP